jgi:peptide/nickel transport system substrate-binding protein
VSFYPVTTRVFEPKAYYGTVSSLAWRCCLLRTLVSFNGRPTAEGGAEPQPDLATSLPEVSSDGLRWTFTLKQGLRYAPPFEDTEIVAQDIVRALTRRSRVWTGSSGYDFYYSPIRGFDEFWAGKADSISGLETPDAHTLVVNLEEPIGDLAYRFTLPATAPIPEGAADGHAANYGRFLAASGPYMIEGSEDLDLSLPPRDQLPVSGFVPGESLILVRNPSWQPGSDQLRPAYVDRIEFTFLPWGLMGDAATYRHQVRLIRSAALDMDLFAVEAPQLKRYLAAQVRLDSTNGTSFIPMNLAVPPFDDIHVRRATVLAVDRAAIAREMGDLYGPMEMRWHIAPDAVEGGLLQSWRPEWLSSARSNLEAARAEMARSRYDRNRDGRCDAHVCSGVRALVQGWSPLWWGYHWEPIGKALSRIGIGLDATEVGFDQVQARMDDPEERWGIIIGSGTGWSADYPNGSTFFLPLLAGSSVSEVNNMNYSLVGAAPDQLTAWGYPVTDVPSVDGRMDRCMDLSFSAQERCWADLDVYLMNDVTPWVPLPDWMHAAVLSERVVHYSFDQSVALPAFDQIALAPGSD